MSRLVSRSETWERAYEAFQSINFAAFDYNTVKQSLLDYMKLYFPETFNDYIETSEFIAIIEIFAYIAELTAYRLDVNAHENFISSAQRKESILRLAKLVSYTAARPLPARGLVKITSISTTESIIDANGLDLGGRTIRWSDVTNVDWKDQFILIMNRVLQQDFGTVGPTDRFQIQDVLFELYAWNLTPLSTGVFTYTASVSGQSVPMELVPVAYDTKLGIVERRPAENSGFTLLYGQDGLGDASDTTGFFLFTKQGQLQRFRATFDGITPNQTYDINADNVNDTDVWVNNVDPATGETLDEPSLLPYRRETTAGKSGEWVQVDLAHAQNVIFNTNPKRNKYEIETRDKNRARIVFGDGEFADIPSGTFDIWARSSLDQDIVVQQSAVTNTSASFTYVDSYGRVQTLTFTFTLINSLQNASAAEDMEHVRVTAPSVYYSQDRMVNGEDYNVFMLQDPSILKLRAINRTFAGDSKYITWHDASGTYENVKLFSDDGMIYFENRDTVVTTPVVDASTLISTYIEPLLSSTDIFLQITSFGVPLSSYRRVFNTAEKTRITTALTSGQPPSKIELYYNKVTFEWYALLESASPGDTPSGSGGTETGLALVGWNSDPALNQFIPYPLIRVTQFSNLELAYDVTRTARRLICQSVTTSFWNTNDASRVVDYDTLRSNYDMIVVLQANPNNSLDGILKANVNFDVLGQETTQDGLPDIHRLSLIPQDANGDGVPDNLDPDDYTNPQGIADLINPKYQVVSPGVGVDIVLRVPFVVDPVTLKTSDVTLIGQGGTLSSTEWEARNVTVGGSGVFVTSTIRLLNATKAPIGTNIQILQKEYVYFNRLAVTDDWLPVAGTVDNMQSYVRSVSILQDGLWSRQEGKGNLNFMWMHRSSRYHLVDPSPSNIIDSFIIPKGYYTSLKRWLEDPLAVQPALPTPLDLRTSYGYLLDNKMISDTLVLHPGRIKLLFGMKAIPELRASFKIVRSADRTLTDNQIKTIAVTAIRNFFDITLWEFGETFFYTELAAVIHAALPTEISSVVLVPSAAATQFGDMFEVPAREDEIFYPDISVGDIDIVAGYTATNLRLNG